MNNIKAQREIFNAIARGKPVGRFVVDEKNIFVSVNEYFGVVIPTKSIMFNLDKTTEMHQLPIMDMIHPNNKMEKTGIEKEVKYHGRKKRYTELRKVDRKVYVDSICKKYFESPNFYQGKNEKSAVVITDWDNEKNDHIVAGLIMPFCMGDEQ